tara:strand:+ start:297 stop:569 length:273 start_codon:yes stop_codon:yes gene_type:complete
VFSRAVLIAREAWPLNSPGADERDGGWKAAFSFSLHPSRTFRKKAQVVDLLSKKLSTVGVMLSKKWINRGVVKAILQTDPKLDYSVRVSR